MSQTKNKTGRKYLYIFLGIALIIRLFAFFGIGTHLNPKVHDEYTYDELGENIALGKGLTLTSVPDVPIVYSDKITPKVPQFEPGYFYDMVKIGQPTAFFSPLYPLYLSFFYKFFSHQIWIPVLFQILFGVLGCYLLFRIGEMAFNPQVGWIAGLIGAVYPLTIYYEVLLMSESLFIFLIILTIYIYYRMKDKPTLPGLILLGICFGLSFLTRSIIFYFLPILLLFVVWKKGRKYYLSSLWVLLGLGLVIIPWVIRNDIEFGKPILFPTNGGYNLHRFIQEFLWSHPLDPENFTPEGGAMLSNPNFSNEPELKRSIILYRLSKHFLEDHPRFYLNYFYDHLVDSLRFYSPDTQSIVLKMVSSLTYGVILLLSIPGIIIGWKRYPSARILGVLILFYIIMNALVVGGIRFRIPIDAFLILFASLTLFDLYTRIQRLYAGTALWSFLTPGWLKI